MNNPFKEQKAYPNLVESFGIIAWVLLASLLIGIPLFLVKYMVPDSASTSFDSIIQMFGYAIPFATVSFFIYKRHKRLDSTFSLKFNLPNLKILLLLIPLTLAIGIVIEPITTFIPMPEWVQKLFENMMRNDIYTLITVAFLAPFFEEVIFRGFILNGLLKNYSPQKAILWSAFLFGIVHLNPWQFIGAFLIGTVIGWLYWKTNSIIPGMLIHFVNNFTASMLMMFSDDSVESFSQWIGNSTQYYAVGGLSIITIIFSYFYLQKYFKQQEPLTQRPLLD